MSLRLRLTLLYSTLVGGILLVFGTAVYILISVILLNQVDNVLAATARDIIEVTTVDRSGEVSAISLPSLDMTANTYVQVWGRDGKLKSSSPGIAALRVALDPAGLETRDPVYRENTLNGVHLRVLTVPLQVGDHKVAVLQVGASLTVVDAARANLLNVLMASAVVSAALAALGSWLVLGRSLAPLRTVTETAQAINRADDLSRRIPYSGPVDDEIGGLIESFNQTLERLEVLFTSQRRLLADVSHELRTPLTVIKGNVDLMRRMGKLDDESLTSINLEAGRLTRLVGGLLLLAQAESGKLSLDMKPVELDTLVLEVFQEMRVLAGEKVRSEALQHRSDADHRGSRPAEAGAAQRGGECDPVHAAGRRGTDESVARRRAGPHHHSRHGARHTEGGPAVHLRAFLSRREVANARSQQRVRIGAFDRAVDRGESRRHDQGGVRGGEGDDLCHLAAAAA